MSLQRGRRIEDVTVGEFIPQLSFEVSLISLVMYAGATWDFHRFHYDQAYVESTGVSAPFMDGQMAGALMARQLMAWAGPDAFVRRLSFRLRNMVLVGERITLTAQVTGTAVECGNPVVLCTVSIVKSYETTVVRDATAAIELSVMDRRASAHPME